MPVYSGPTTWQTVVHDRIVCGARCTGAGGGGAAGIVDSGGDAGAGAGAGGAAGAGARGGTSAGAARCGRPAGACGVAAGGGTTRGVIAAVLAAVKGAARPTIPVSTYCVCALKSCPLEQTKSSGTHSSTVLSAYNGPTAMSGWLIARMNRSLGLPN